MLMRILQILGIFFSLFILYFVMLLFCHAQILAGILVMIFLLISTTIFLKDSFYSLRYMYPSLVTFALFLIFPMLLTVAVAFTNYGTGNKLSFQEAYQHFLEETEDDVFSFDLENEQNQTRLIIHKGSEKYSGIIPNPLAPMMIKLTAFQEKAYNKKFSNREKAKFCSKIQQCFFELPDGTTAKLSGTNLVVSSKKYIAVENFGLRHQKTQKIFLPDRKTGFFSYKQENLIPGFYIFNGLENFKTIFTQSYWDFFHVFVWNCIFAFFSVLGSFAVGLFFSLLLQEKLRFKILYRVFLIIPYSIPFFITVLIFRGFLHENPDFGIINHIFQKIGITAIPWLMHPTYAKISCILLNIYLGYSYMLLSTTGILQSIPPQIYETAKLDGVTWYTKLTKIVLPLIGPPILPLLLGSFAFNFCNFVGIYLLTGGGPAAKSSGIIPLGATDILLSWIYKMSFASGAGERFNIASALTIIIFFLLIGITILQYRISKTKD